jgi:hypothetical protein
MTTDEILAGIDSSLAAIATERERLLEARAQLAGGSEAPARPTAPRRRGRRRRGRKLQTVLESLDPTVPRTAGEVEKLTGVGRAVAGSTLSRLAKQGLATKAARGYLLAAAARA